MDSFKLKKCNKYTGLFKNFLGSFLIICGIIIGILVLYYQKKSNDYIRYLEITEEQTLKLGKSIILQKINPFDTSVVDTHNKKQELTISNYPTADIISIINNCTRMSLWENYIGQRRWIFPFRITGNRA